LSRGAEWVKYELAPETLGLAREVVSLLVARGALLRTIERHGKE
jgi:hypothetical protein